MAAKLGPALLVGEGLTSHAGRGGKGDERERGERRERRSTLWEEEEGEEEYSTPPRERRATSMF